MTEPVTRGLACPARATEKEGSSEKVIYLDQKCWINLAKIQYGNPTEQENTLLQKIINVSDDGTAIFPISMANLMETNKINNTKWREQLSSLMAKISKSNVISPFWGHILDLEVENLVRKTRGLPQYNIRQYWLGKGISHLMGMKIHLKNEEQYDPETIKRSKKDIEVGLNDPKNIEKVLLDHFRNPELEKENRKTIEILENNRRKLLDIPDNKMRYKMFLAHNFSAIITPRLAKTLINYNLPKEYCETVIPQFDIEKILPYIPTALCEFTLIFRRDQYLQREIEPNDTPDLWHLILAIPYSDIVVTENMWTTIAKQSKLDQMCDTVILKSVNELYEYI